MAKKIDFYGFANSIGAVESTGTPKVTVGNLTVECGQLSSCDAAEVMQTLLRNGEAAILDAKVSHRETVNAGVSIPDIKIQAGAVALGYATLSAEGGTIDDVKAAYDAAQQKAGNNDSDQPSLKTAAGKRTKKAQS